MLLPIINDTIEKSVPLKDIELGGFFRWNDDYLMRRLHSNTTDKVFSATCKIPCEHMPSGEAISIDRDCMVRPVKCELHITEE